MRTLLTGLAVIASVAPALASPAYLKLVYGPVITDPAGAFVNVQVQNAGTIMLAQIVVTCDFMAGKKKVGTSSTTLFSSFPGVTGQDQVRLMGATTATTATCSITSPAS